MSFGEETRRCLAKIMFLLSGFRLPRAQASELFWLSAGVLLTSCDSARPLATIRESVLFPHSILAGYSTKLTYTAAPCGVIHRASRVASTVEASPTDLCPPLQARIMTGYAVHSCLNARKSRDQIRQFSCPTIDAPGIDHTLDRWGGILLGSESQRWVAESTISEGVRQGT